MTTRTIEIEIPHEAPSLNTRDREHWASLSRRRTAYELAIRQALREGPAALPGPGVPVRISLHSYRWALTHDEDNLVGGHKGMLDALVACGLATDDSRDLVAVDYSQSVDRANRRTRIRVQWEASENWGTGMHTNGKGTIARVIVQGGDGEHYVARIKASLALSDDDVARLPIAEATEALLRAGRAHDGEGKNTLKLAIKRDLGPQTIRVDGPAGAVEIAGATHAVAPQFRVVEGVPGLVATWDVTLDAVQLVTLCGSVGPEVDVEVQDAQRDLFSVEEAA